MRRPNFEDFKLLTDGRSIYNWADYSNAQDKYIDYLEKLKVSEGMEWGKAWQNKSKALEKQVKEAEKDAEKWDLDHQKLAEKNDELKQQIEELKGKFYDLCANDIIKLDVDLGETMQGKEAEYVWNLLKHKT